MSLEQLVAQRYQDTSGARAAHFRLGYSDRRYGLSHIDNPFPEGTLSAEDWRAGWDAAKCRPPALLNFD